MVFILKSKHVITVLLCCLILFFTLISICYCRKENGTAALSPNSNWGLSFQEKGKAPVGNVSSEFLKKYNSYYIGNSLKKNIYLTFDAGYENGNTESILDTLKKHNVKATFFVVGHYLETAPEIVQRMVKDGHIVGNHTYHHLDMSKISSLESFSKEIKSVEILFEKLTGQKMEKYYRPPQGKFNTLNLENAQKLGYKTIFWSLAYVDWNENKQPTREEALKKLMTRIHPGAIVLLHSTSQTNANILDELLTKWESAGYTFETLHEL